MKPTNIEKLWSCAQDKSWELKCDLQKLYPRLYLLKFDPNDSYDMCMTFCRYQEKYESPNPKFRGKDFALVDFMEWYSKNSNGYFSYPIDWAGFNIPNTIFKANWFHNIRDKNKYDYFMLQAYYAIWHDIKYNSIDTYLDFDLNDPKYYLIGATDALTIKHEMAHGFYYLIPKYKKEMDTLTKKLPKKFVEKVYSWFENIGYTKKVFKDEMQAYMATGFPSNSGIVTNKLNGPFEKMFDEYYKKC